MRIDLNKMTKEEYDKYLRCVGLRQRTIKEHSMAWRVYYYLRRHSDMKEKNETAYQVVELFEIIQFSNGEKSMEDAKSLAEFLADLYNKYPHKEAEFIPTQEQLDHFNNFSASELMEQTKELFDFETSCKRFS